MDLIKIMNHIPRKRFGQHFLHDQNVINEIVKAIAPLPLDHLVEIGPGLGAITTVILPMVNQLEVVELDRDLIPELEEKCKALGHLKIYQADALRFNFAALAQTPLRIFGNLPYNISTPLIFHLLDFVQSIQDMNFMVQKEVAERMAALPGPGDYGALSVMLQYHCRVELLFGIHPHSFTPPPKVDSAFVRLTPTQPKLVAKNVQILRKVVRQAFSQRRKMLHNSLKELIMVAQLEALGIDPNTRPEQLAVEDFVKITNMILSCPQN